MTDVVANALAGLAARQRRFSVKSVNGGSPADDLLGQALTRAGFVTGYRGLSWRGDRSS
jgi:hypothetical protein